MITELDAKEIDGIKAILNEKLKLKQIQYGVFENVKGELCQCNHFQEKQIDHMIPFHKMRFSLSMIHFVEYWIQQNHIFFQGVYTVRYRRFLAGFAYHCY